MRILTGEQMHILRFSPSGLYIYTPQRIDMVAGGEIRFKSVHGRMAFDAETIYFYANEEGVGRMLLKKIGTTV
jgi:hypothetical protein